MTLFTSFPQMLFRLVVAPDEGVVRAGGTAVCASAGSTSCVGGEVEDDCVANPSPAGYHSVSSALVSCPSSASAAPACACDVGYSGALTWNAPGSANPGLARVPGFEVEFTCGGVSARSRFPRRYSATGHTQWLAPVLVAASSESP